MLMQNEDFSDDKKPVIYSWDWKLHPVFKFVIDKPLFFSTHKLSSPLQISQLLTKPHHGSQNR
jgi:hypothetical protein